MAWVGWDLNDQQVSILCCWTGLPPASFLQQLCRQGVLQMPFCCTFMLDLIQPNCEEEILPLFLHRLLLPLLGHEHDCPFPCHPVFSYHQKILKFQPLKASIQTRICAHLHFICVFFSFSFFFPQFLSVWFYKLGHFSGKDKFLPLEMYGLLPFGLSYCEKTKQNTTIKVFIQWLQAALERSKASGLQLNKQNIYSVPLD